MSNIKNKIEKYIYIRLESINKIMEISNARENQEIVNICELLLSIIIIGKT